MVESLQELADLQERASFLARGIPSTVTAQDAMFVFVGAISRFFRTEEGSALTLVVPFLHFWQRICH